MQQIQTSKRDNSDEWHEFNLTQRAKRVELENGRLILYINPGLLMHTLEPLSLLQSTFTFMYTSMHLFPRVKKCPHKSDSPALRYFCPNGFKCLGENRSLSGFRRRRKISQPVKEEYFSKWCRRGSYNSEKNWA